MKHRQAAPPSDSPTAPAEQPPQLEGWTRFATWQLEQLARLADRDRDRAESILNTMWAMHPSLLSDLAIGAVEQGSLEVQDAARLLGIPQAEVARRAEAFRAAAGDAAIRASERGAVVADSHMFVWEIVREYRKIGSIEGLTESFPGLGIAQLGAALRYARENPAEIEAAIAAYEEMRSRKRREYPFS